MPIESRTAPEETPELAAHAAAMIDAALVGTGLARDVYWDAVRKGYNTPYNDPPPKHASAAQPVVVAPPAAVVADSEIAPLPVAAMAALASEVRAV